MSQWLSIVTVLVAITCLAMLSGTVLFARRLRQAEQQTHDLLTLARERDDVLLRELRHEVSQLRHSQDLVPSGTFRLGRA
jgi:hypothetical protein